MPLGTTRPDVLADLQVALRQIAPAECAISDAVTGAQMHACFVAQGSAVARPTPISGGRSNGGAHCPSR